MNEIEKARKLISEYEDLIQIQQERITKIQYNCKHSDTEEKSEKTYVEGNYYDRSYTYTEIYVICRLCGATVGYHTTPKQYGGYA